MIEKCPPNVRRLVEIIFDQVDGQAHFDALCAFLEKCSQQGCNPGKELDLFRSEVLTRSEVSRRN